LCARRSHRQEQHCSNRGSETREKRHQTLHARSSPFWNAAPQHSPTFCWSAADQEFSSENSEEVSDPATALAALSTSAVEEEFAKPRARGLFIKHKDRLHKARIGSILAWPLFCVPEREVQWAMSFRSPCAIPPERLQQVPRCAVRRQLYFTTAA